MNRVSLGAVRPPAPQEAEGVGDLPSRALASSCLIGEME
jgi:hypothetical protein